MIEPEEIYSNNSLIAEFMGYPKDEQGRGYIIPDLPHIRATVLCSNKYLNFHSDWDWIMPVVDKIFKSLVGNIEDWTFKHERRIKESLSSVDIQKTWQLVVEYIKEKKEHD